MHYLLGIDLGTSGLKAVVVDAEGRPLGKGLARNRYLPGQPGWAEQDPRTWWVGCCQAIQDALAQAKVSAVGIAGIGVCGFHHCPVFLDAEGEPTRPTIVTHDRRLGDSLADLAQRGVLEQVIETSGSPVMTGHFPPIYHLVRSQDPAALEKTRWILLAKDYLRFKLTGEIGTEICDASGTNLVAMPAPQWCESLCQLLGVPRGKLPPIGVSSQVAGHVTGEASRATGLVAGTPVVYGGGDSHCALVGLGVAGSGAAGLLMGTNSTLRASFDGLVKPLDQSVWIQQHVIPERFTVSASSMTGSSVLDWFTKACVGVPGEMLANYDELESLAEGVPAGSDGLLFHPYLYGERSPFYNPEARGSFLAIRHWHGKGHLVRSVMEGVAFCIANCFDAIQSIACERNDSIAILRTGQSGGSRLPIWRQMIADAVDHPLQVIGVEEPGCLGAALLAGVGVGAYGTLQDAIAQNVRVAARILPDATNAGLYRERRAVFNDAYRALEPILYQPGSQAP
jgi:xylulokinase